MYCQECDQIVNPDVLTANEANDLSNGHSVYFSDVFLCPECGEEIESESDYFDSIGEFDEDCFDWPEYEIERELEWSGMIDERCAY